jgi:hemerythrin superfamily protein
MPNAIELLTHDHRKVEALFERYEGGDASVIEQICNELTVHIAIEEKVLYPVLPEVTDGEGLRREAEHEHEEVEDAIRQIEQAGGAQAKVDELMRTIIQGVKHHVSEEEGEVFPKLGDELGAARLSELGRELASAKRSELAAKGLLIDLTKDELYELAQSTGVEGRSDMSKDQLVDALQV